MEVKFFNVDEKDENKNHFLLPSSIRMIIAGSSGSYSY